MPKYESVCSNCGLVTRLKPGKKSSYRCKKCGSCWDTVRQVPSEEVQVTEVKTVSHSSQGRSTEWRLLKEHPWFRKRQSIEVSEGMAWLVCTIIVFGFCILAYVTTILIGGWSIVVAVGVILILGIFLFSKNDHAAFNRVVALVFVSPLYAIIVLIMLSRGEPRSTPASDNSLSEPYYSPWDGKPRDMPQEQWDFVNKRLEAEFPDWSKADTVGASQTIWEFEKQRKMREGR